MSGTKSQVMYLILALFGTFVSALSLFVPDTAITWFADNHIYWSPISEVSYNIEIISSKRDATVSTTTVPCTVMTTNATSITKSTLDSLVNEFSADDVWTSSFLQCIYLQYDGPGAASVDISVADFLESAGTEYVYIESCELPENFLVRSSIYLTAFSGASPLLDGPYIANISPSGISFSQVFAAARDYSASFQSPVVSKSNESYEVQHLAVKGYLDTFVPIPSRLYSRKDTRPLAGLRFGSKDIFPVKGVRMTGGSKAYFSVHNASESTCVVLQKLIDLGAVFVGTTKTFAFSSVDIATDYLMPWNPRGDGALNTGGSSIGSGSAVSSYDWIDFAVGADTGGSVRGPANAGGIYGYRPTQGIMPLEGVIPAITEQDTAGHLARSPYLFSTVGKAWYAGLGGLRSYSKIPASLLVGTDLTFVPYEEQMNQYEDFLIKLETFMGVTRTNINITSTWAETSNISQDLNDWASPIYYDMNNVENWNEVGKPLAEAYGAEHDGAFPPVEIGLINQWHQGMNDTIIEREPESAAKRPVFKSWLEKEILHNDTESCSEGLLIYSNTAAPYYRTLIHYPFTTYIYLPLYIAAYAGNPEISIPIGQASYNSSRSNITEQYPMSVNIQAAAGCDYVLFDLVEKLADAGILNTTLTGKLAFWGEGVEQTLGSGMLGTEKNLREGFPF